MDATAGMSATNQRVYQNAARARWYASLEGLTPAEEAGFALTRDRWAGGEVLDIGIGGGRTCEVLAREAKRYVGVDYSPAMVEAATARHPKLDIRQGDARDLSQFADASFDWAFFADNGIDAVDDTDRMRVLAEVRRVLRPGGVFLFNSHNLDCSQNHWGDMLRVRISRSPVATLKSFARVPLRLRNYMRTARARTDRYVIRPDPGNDFSSPHYYTTAVEVRRQLAAAGFELAAMLDAQGRGAAASIDRDSPTLYYVARRPAG